MCTTTWHERRAVGGDGVKCWKGKDGIDGGVESWTGGSWEMVGLFVQRVRQCCLQCCVRYN